jgi:hypothetical protein
MKQKKHEPQTPAERKRNERKRSARFYKALGLTQYQILKLVRKSDKTPAQLRAALELI